MLLRSETHMLTQSQGYDTSWSDIKPTGSLKLYERCMKIEGEEKALCHDEDSPICTDSEQASSVAEHLSC